MARTEWLRLPNLRLRWIAPALLLVAVLIAAPFLFTTQLARFILAREFPANHPALASAELSRSGKIVLRDLVLHDTGASSQKPLVTASEIDAAFEWRALLARKMRSIRIHELTVYARSNASSQLSLAQLLFEQLPSNANPAALPLWIDRLELSGTIRSEPIAGFTTAPSAWPLDFHMTMSGERPEPSRHLSINIGDQNKQAGFGMSGEIETSAVSNGIRVKVSRLAAKQMALAIDAAALRPFVADLPSEIQGRIESKLRKLSLSGELDLPARTARSSTPSINAALSFEGIEMRVPHKSAAMLTLDDLGGAAKIDTPFPLGSATRITIEHLQTGNITATLDADDLRKFTTQIPADWHGDVNADLRQLNLVGRVSATPKGGPQFKGNLRLQDLNARSPAAREHSIALSGLGVSGSFDTPLNRWIPRATYTNDGAIEWSGLSFGKNSVNHFAANVTADGRTLSAKVISAQVFDGQIAGTSVIGLVAHETSHADFQLKGIDVHQALSNLSPDNFDAQGHASGSLHVAASSSGDLSGDLDLTFDGPGTLRIGQIDEVKQMLAGNFGLDLANLAMHDLERYPFKQGVLHLESAGPNSLLKIKFVRQAKTAADVISPHQETINGQDVMVGSLVVPTIDMTVPITGKSLAEILSMASGVHPLVEIVGGKPSKEGSP